jgi:hypothetical protein
MERVKGNADGQKNIEMRRLINDTNARHQPLEILQEKISVLEETEHAQVHTNTRDQPFALGVALRFADLPAEPEIHRRGREEQRREGRIPRAVKNVTGDYEQILARGPVRDPPVEGNDDNEKNDERERVEQHDVGNGVALF